MPPSGMPSLLVLRETCHQVVLLSESCTEMLKCSKAFVHHWPPRGEHFGAITAFASSMCL